MIQVAVIPGESGVKKNLLSFLEPLVNELEVMSQDGMIVETGEGPLRCKAHLFVASGDIPGVAALINHSGHNSYSGCRICKVRGVRLQSPNEKGMAQYFPAGTPVGALRTRDEFLHGDPVSY